MDSHTHTHTHTHTDRTQGQCLEDMKDTLTAPLTLSHGLVDEVMLGLQLGDQVPAFQKLLQLLQHKDTHTHTHRGVTQHIHIYTV